MLGFYDANSNRFPQIYTNAINPSSSAPLDQQVEEFFAPLRSAGFHPVPIEAYFDKFAFENDSVQFKHLAGDVKRDLIKRSNVAGNYKDYEIVFVWDIEEITMLARNCLAEVGMLRSDIDVNLLWISLKRILASAGFYNRNDLIQGNVVNIEDLLIDETDDLEVVASTYSSLKKFYNEISNDDHQIVSRELLKKCGLIEHENVVCHAARRHQEVFNQRWKTAKKSLELVNRRSAESQGKKYANVVITQEELSLGIAQILLCDNSKQIAIENIYTTLHSSEKLVLERIQRKFGEKCLLVQISSRSRYWDRPYTRWQVRANESIKLLYKAQRHVLLKDGIKKSKLVSDESTSST